MSELFKALILAIIQGITEWLPVSSSGHLTLAEKMLNYQGSITFHVALHFGTLMTLFIYFGREITDIIQDILKLKFHTENGKLGVLILIATIPAALVGFIFKKSFESIFSNLTILTVGLGITGLVLIIASLPLKYKNQKITKTKAFLIGTSQILSLIPGISRSGTTISTALFLGLKEKTAVKFSYLISIPIILGANISIIGNQTLPKELIWATLTSFLTGLVFIHFFFTYILSKRRNLRYLGIYTLILSITIIIFLILF